MKKTYISHILLAAFALSIVISCRDESKIIYDTAKLPAGVYARMLAVPPATISSTVFDATTFPFQVEVVGVGTNSAAITALNIKVTYLNDTSGVVKAAVTLGSVSGFALNSQTQLPNATGSFTGAAIRTALGLAPTDLKQKYYFDFKTQLVLADGRTFDATNFDPNMTNSFYKAAYEYITTLTP